MRVGLTVFLNTLRTSGSWGVGDYADLADLAQHAWRAGIDFLALGPTNACAVSGHVLASPYSPQSRLFKSILHLRPDSIAGWESVQSGEKRQLLARAHELNQLPLLDLTRVRDLKLTGLRATFECIKPGLRLSPEFERFCSEMAPELDAFATYSAAQLRLGPAWPGWPEPLRRPETAVRSRWAWEHSDDLQFFRWCQWQLDRQFASTTRHGPVILTDLPVGTPYLSADCWQWQDHVRPDLQLGSPPDYFNANGHQWALTPFDPRALAEIDYRPAVAAVRNSLRHSIGIRVDHAFGLIRQYCLPADGPGDALWIEQAPGLGNAIAREAGRAHAIVMSEELGTPPPEGTGPLRALGFRRQAPYISNQFDRGCDVEMASLSCHDLPTVGSLLRPDDGAHALDPAFREQACERLRRLEPCVEELPVNDAIIALYRRLGERVSGLVTFMPEDVLGLDQPVNLPGVAEQDWPSFLCRLPCNSVIARSLGFRRIATALRATSTAAASRA